MLTISESMAGAFPTRCGRDDPCYRNSQAQQNAESQKNQFHNTENTGHGE